MVILTFLVAWARARSIRVVFESDGRISVILLSASPAG